MPSARSLSPYFSPTSRSRSLSRPLTCQTGRRSLLRPVYVGRAGDVSQGGAGRGRARGLSGGGRLRGRRRRRSRSGSLLLACMAVGPAYAAQREASCEDASGSEGCRRSLSLPVVSVSRVGVVGMRPEAACGCSATLFAV